MVLRGPSHRFFALLRVKASVHSSDPCPLVDLDDLSCESCLGGFWSQVFAGFPTFSPSISVGPTIFVAPMLRSSSNSFNFFANRDSFNGSDNFVLLA